MTADGAATESGSLTLGLHVAGAGDPLAVGTKAATLSALVAAGFAVPEGIVLTTAALDAPASALDAAITAIAARFGDATLAVRSSAVDEDGALASFAGQFTSVLNVHGPDELRAAVRTVQASATGERVAAYRGGPAVPAIAVLVQRQVAADVAGVAFTADPVTGQLDAVRIEAVPGLGDAVVDGSADPDEWLVRGANATPLQVRHQALSAAQAVAVAALATRIQDLRGCPQDVEWAMADGRLLVLQARPITALPAAPAVELPPGTWVKEIERHPEPLTELGASGAAALISRGLTTMSREAGGLVDRFEARMIAGEPYMQIVPLGGRGGPPPPWWVLGLLARVAPPLRRQMRRAKQLLRPGVLEAVQLRWEQEWRPQVQDRIDRLRSVRLADLSDGELVAHLDETLATLDHCLDLHFRLTVPYLIPVHGLVVECGRLGWPEAKALELLAGTSEATSAPSRALAELAEAVRADPAAVAALDAAPLEGLGTDLQAALNAADPALGAAYADWCDRYGGCCANDDPGSPQLLELPGALAALLRDAVQAVAEDRQRRTAGMRAARADEARQLLASRPAAERDRFERALAAALRAYPLREDSAFWTGSMPAGLLRASALEFGRRLVARRVLVRPDDAVNLSLDALRGALDPAAADSVRTAVARARAERAYVRANPGPPFLGPPPGGLPDLRGLPRAGRIVNEAMLSMQRRRAASGAGSRHSAPEPAPAGDVLLTGTPASSGTHTGVVRIVAGPTQFGRVRAGDVLVCPTTDPAWSVLFGVAGALVTDGGNVLSHAAIVAREHAIPAVVGTGTATSSLRDGQLVTVDGSTGHVHQQVPHPEKETP